MLEATQIEIIRFCFGFLVSKDSLSFLSDFRHNITVQQETPMYNFGKHLQRLPSSPDSPPASPSFVPRLRAIACEYRLAKLQTALKIVVFFCPNGISNLTE